MLIESQTEQAVEAIGSRAFWPRVFWVLLAGICGTTLFIGLAPQPMFGHDVFFLIDNAYRVLQGQVPHRDFQSAWGPLIYLIDALGLWLAGLRPAGIGYANAVCGAALAVWAWALARRRMSEAAACVIGVYTLLLIVAPYPLGWGPLNFGAAMSYNRYGFALLGIVIVGCGSGAGLGWSSGVACGLLGFLKVTYGMAAVPLMLVVGGKQLWERKRLAAIAAGAALVVLAALAYLRFDVAAMLGDLAMAASGRSRSWRPMEVLTLGFGQMGESVPLMLLAWLAARAGRARWCGIAAVTVALGGLLLSTNHQPSSLPLNPYVAVLLADRYFRKFQGYFLERVTVGLLAGLCLFPLFFQSGLSMLGAAQARWRGPGPEIVKLDSARGAEMLFPTSPFETETGGPAYVREVNEGMALLRAHTASNEGVLAVDMVNPFNYLMARPSPTGGMASHSYNFVFSDTRHPSPEKWLGSTRWVIVRKYSPAAKDYPVENSHIQGTLRIYQPALTNGFEVAGETPHWLLWRKK